MLCKTLHQTGLRIEERVYLNLKRRRSMQPTMMPQSLPQKSANAKALRTNRHFEVNTASWNLSSKIGGKKCSKFHCGLSADGFRPEKSFSFNLGALGCAPAGPAAVPSCPATDMDGDGGVSEGALTGGGAGGARESERFGFGLAFGLSTGGGAGMAIVREAGGAATALTEAAVCEDGRLTISTKRAGEIRSFRMCDLRLAVVEGGEMVALLCDATVLEEAKVCEEEDGAGTREQQASSGDGP